MRTSSLAMAGTTCTYQAGGASVSILPVPRFGPEQIEEIRRRRAVLPPDLGDDPAYAINSPRWDDYCRYETEKGRKAGFLADRDYNFGPPARRHRPLTRTSPPPPPPRPKEMWGEDILGMVVWDDSDGFIASVFHDIQMTMEEGREIELLEELTEEEVMRLGILISELPQPPPSMPRYTVEHMSDEDTYDQALQASVPQPPPSYPWAAVASPPPPPTAPAFAPPVPDRPWVILDLVDQTQCPTTTRHMLGLGFSRSWPFYIFKFLFLHSHYVNYFFNKKNCENKCVRPLQAPRTPDANNQSILYNRFCVRDSLDANGGIHSLLASVLHGPLWVYYN